MKTLILASMLAFGATSAVVAPVQAAKIIIQNDNGDDGDNGNGGHKHRHQQNDDEDNFSNNDGNGGGHHRHHRHNCHTELVKHWRHHHKVVEEVTVCG